MFTEEKNRVLSVQSRSVAKAVTGDEDLGPLADLPGTWKNLPNLPGRGWNMIALPFATESRLNYRLLLNQYNEELKFTFVDKGVPNRGIEFDDMGNTSEQDQLVVTLDYEQMITQIAADDNPVSGKAGDPGLAIHHEPGLFLNMTNFITDDLDLARLATIPHGDSVLALGRSSKLIGGPKIPDENGLPIGVNQDLNRPYLSPYKHYHDKPFLDLFDPVNPNELLKAANQGVDIVETTELHFDTTFATGGIHNIPFIVRQANAAEMRSTFWIQKLREKDSNGNHKLRIQYTQTVLLDFFPRRDGQPGLIRWPHVSINTMEKVSDE